MPNVFDTNDIRTTGLTVEGKTVLSGNSDYVILEVTGSSGTNLQVIDAYESELVWSTSGTTGFLFDVWEDHLDASVPLFATGTSLFDNVTVNNDLIAGSKSFDIPHPKLPGFRIRHGSLEGPEHGVYHRGKTTSSIIYFPDFWDGLVEHSTITIQLTANRNHRDYCVKDTTRDHIEISSEDGVIDCFYLIHAERIDVPKITVIYKQL